MTRLINLKPNRLTGMTLVLIPFIVLIIVYLVNSYARLEINPNDKLLPSVASICKSIVTLATETNKRTGTVLLWADTYSSLRLLLIGMTISAVIGLIFGILNGAIPLIRGVFSPLFTCLSLIPPMAILPILFISFGLGDFAKIMLIIIGIAPFLVRDLEQSTRSLPEEIIVKSLTLGASSWQILIRVILPQVLPRLIESIRLSLGSAWLFLIAAEAIAATSGLGYRIFLVRRYMDMSVIFPYVVWITLLAFAMDYILKTTSRKCFKWYFKLQGAR